MLCCSAARCLASLLLHVHALLDRSRSLTVPAVPPLPRPAPAEEEALQRSRMSARRGRLSPEDMQRMREQQALADQVRQRQALMRRF